MTLALKIVPFLFVLSAPLCATQSITVDPRIRTTEPRLHEMFEVGYATSPTLRQIVDEIDRSDLIVYLIFDRQPDPHVAAHVWFMGAAGGHRFLHVGLDRGLLGAELIGMLAHELQHVAEIARDRSVVDVSTLRNLYGRIGYVDGARGLAERFDSAAAIDAGRRAAKEVLEAAATASASHDRYLSVR